jgi:hypothetical protein
MAGRNLLRKFLPDPGGVGTEGYVNFIAYRRSCFHSRATRQFQHGRCLQRDWGETPGPQFALDVDYGMCAIEVDHVDGKPHAQSMNAAAGDNPEAAAITEVTLSQAEKPAQARPVSIRYGHRCGKRRLASSVESLPPRGENGHNEFHIVCAVVFL